jgi:hypothetical protein
MSGSLREAITNRATIDGYNRTAAPCAIIHVWRGLAA